MAISIVLKPIAIFTNRAKWRALPRAKRVLYLLTPVMAIATVERSQPATRVTFLRLLGLTLVWGTIVMLYYLAFWSIFRRHFQPSFWDGYYIIPLIYFIGEFLGGCVQVWGCLVSRQILAAHHERPYMAASLRDFWSHRWNTWVSDTFREFFLDRIELKAFYYVAVIFVLSGIIHEFLINIPYLLNTGRNLFGSMMIYFVLQIVGLYLERTSFVPGTPANRLFMYMVVLGPSPLVLNEAFLHTIAIWPH